MSLKNAVNLLSLRTRIQPRLRTDKSKPNIYTQLLTNVYAQKFEQRARVCYAPL